MGWGTFLFFSIASYVGVVYIYMCLPELKGRSIESMDDLFARSLWTMWRHAYPTEEEKTLHGVQDRLAEEDAKATGVAYADDDENNAKARAEHQERRL